MLTKEQRDDLRRWATPASPELHSISNASVISLLDALDEMERERDAAWLAGAAAMRKAAAAEARRDGSVMLASCIDRIALLPRP